MASKDKQAAELRAALEKAVAKDRPKDQVTALEGLERLEPKEPRWPHRRGDTLRRMGKGKDAEVAYLRAMQIYAAQGFVARAVAVAKMVVDLNPARAEILDRLDTEAGRALRQQQMKPGFTAPPPRAGSGGPSRPPASPSFHAPPAAAVPPAAPISEEPVVLDFDDEAPTAARSPSPPPAAPARVPSAPAPRAPSAPVPSAPQVSAPPPSSARQALKHGLLGGDRLSLLGAAPRLVAAKDAADDEVRFEDDVDAALELILLDEELSSPELIPGSEAAPEFEGDEHPTAERLSMMSAAGLFVDVPPEVVAELARGADLVERRAGELILKRGDPADALFVLVEGSAHVELPGTDGIDLSEGEVVGEGSLLEGGIRHADVKAKTPLLALRIPRATLARLVTSHAVLGDVLFDLLLRRLVANALQTSPIFAAFDPSTRRELARLFEVRRAAPGMILKERGKRSDGLYLALAGAVDAEDEHGVSRLPLGLLFGHAALLSNAPSTKTVRVVTESVLLRLPAAKFNAFAMEYPPALAHLAELAAEPTAF